MFNCSMMNITLNTIQVNADYILHVHKVWMMLYNWSLNGSYMWKACCLYYLLRQREYVP